MPTTSSDASFPGTGVAAGIPGASGAAGVTGGGLTTSQTTTTGPGSNLLGVSHAKFNYTVVVQVPIPFIALNIDLNTLGAFVLAELSVLGIPQALTWLLSNATALFQTIVEDATDLIKAIPEATVTIQVKVGPTPIINITLIAEDTPVEILPPTFQLGLPNLAVNLNFAPNLFFPPIILRVPIPVPVIKPVRLLGITGGSANASASINLAQPGGAAVAAQPASATVAPGAIVTPIVMPRI